MRRYRPLFYLLVGLSLAGVILSGCGGEQSDPSADTRTTADALVGSDVTSSTDDQPGADLSGSADSQLGADTTQADTTGPSCNNQCATKGTIQCSGNGVQTCVDDGTGCLVWSTPVDCGSDKVCQQGLCNPKPCPDSDCSVIGEQKCTADGTGYQVCSVDPNTGCPKLAAKVVCFGGNLCDTTTNSCQYPSSCISKPTVLLLVDRSPSMADQQIWDGTRVAVREWVRYYWNHVDFGLRVFPQPVPSGTEGCGVGTLNLPKDLKSVGELDALLTAPIANGEGSTALADALNNIVIGDTPTDGTYVILLTDGEEVCKTDAEVLANVDKLRRRGIKVFMVGLGSGYNATLLEQAAKRGGTGSAYYATDGPALYRTLTQIADKLTVCCVDRDGDGTGRHCADTGADCNDSEPKIQQSIDPQVLCDAKTCGLDACGNNSCGVCGPEGDMDGLRSNAIWAMDGFSPTNRSQSPIKPPATDSQSGQLAANRVAWTADTKSPQNWTPFPGGIAVNDNGAIFLTWESKEPSAAKWHQYLIRYIRDEANDKTDTTTLELTLGGEFARVSSAPTLTKNHVLLSSDKGIIVAQRSTMTQVTELPLDDAVASNPVIPGGDGTLYLLGSKFLYALSFVSATGSEQLTLKWFYPTASTWARQVAIAGDGTIYVIGDSLIALNPSGQKLWETAPQGLTDSPVVGADGTIYAEDEMGRVTAFAGNGTTLWSSEVGLLAKKRKLRSRLALTMIDGAEWLVFGTESSTKLHAIKTGDDKGATTISMDLGAGFLAVPVVGATGTVLVASPTQFVYRVDFKQKSIGKYKITDETTPRIVFAPVLAANSQLLVMQSDGTLTAIETVTPPGPGLP